MSHSLDFKSSGPNKDAGLKRSGKIRSLVAQKKKIVLKVAALDMLVLTIQHQHE